MTHVQLLERAQAVERAANSLRSSLSTFVWCLDAVGGDDPLPACGSLRELIDELGADTVEEIRSGASRAAAEVAPLASPTR